MILVAEISLKLNWLPATGAKSFAVSPWEAIRHALLPGIDEVRQVEETPAPEPTLLIPAASRAPLAYSGATPVLHVARDREDEVALFARRVTTPLMRPPRGAPSARAD